MSNECQSGQPRAGRARRWFTVCLLAGALLPASGSAQTSNAPVTVLKSGLHSIFGGHSLMLTATEVGSRTSASTVTIEFRDAAGQLRASVSGRLSLANPVRLRLAIRPEAGLQQLRATVRITSITGGDVSEPIVALEDIDADSVQVVPKVMCMIPPARPPGAQESCTGCPGWQITTDAAAPAAPQ